MKHHAVWVVIAVILAVVFIATPITAVTTHPAQWEYRIVRVAYAPETQAIAADGSVVNLSDQPSHEDTLNFYGSDGWELVWVDVDTSSGDRLFYMKRPLP